jgi:ABC-type branched-subunit amino acid transport system substrate-binding protein
MIKDQLDLFADHQEAIALFERACERKAGEPWSLLPIFSLVGPAGFGKSLLIRHLYFHYCNTPFLPHASLDFGRPNAPHDLLNILGALRNNLRRQRDEHGHTLTFPRFDIIYARLKRSEGLEDDDLDETEELFGDFNDLIGLVGNIHVVLGFLLFAVKLIARIPVLRDILRRLVESAYESRKGKPQWRWYQDQTRRFLELNLSHDAPIGKILRRLNEMCVMGGPEREFLIEQILPKAFLADLRYGDHDNEAIMLQQGPRCIVIFMDSFEVLMRSAESTARQLLGTLALNEYRKRGESDPLLLVVGSEERLPDMSREQLNQHFPAPADPDTGSVLERTRAFYDEWQELHHSQDRHRLRLRDCYFPIPLSNFTLDATRDYLLMLDQYNETAVFSNEALIEDIHQATQGYPIFLERVGTAMQISMQHPRYAITDTESLFDSEQGEQVIDRLLALYCKQIDERRFMISAVPRSLTSDLLGVVLDLPDKATLNTEWQRYQQLAFVLSSEDKQRATFLPGVRAIFLRKLQLTAREADSDYLRIHQRLYDYFTRRSEQNPHLKQVMPERAYHALALGNYQLVVQMAIDAQKHESELWKNLLQVIAEAPTQTLPRQQVEREAAETLYRVRQQATAAEAVRAIVLYTWLLVTPGSDRKHVSSLWYDLGTAYQYLQDIDPGVRRDTATYHYQHANELLDPPLTGIVQSQPQTQTGQLPARPTLTRRQRADHLIRSTYRSVRANRRTQAILMAVLICTVLISLLVPRLLPQQVVPQITYNPFTLALSELQPDAHSRWIGVTVEPDKEFVGLSDGSIPFDYLRPDGTLKIRASDQLRRGDLAGARATLEQAVQSDVNDAEAMIYLQNVLIRQSSKPCIVFVVATRIIEDTSEGVNTGRDNLQGAYIAQQEYNITHADSPMCVYVANIGSNSGYEQTVIQQLINAAKMSNSAIKGLIGWPGLLDSANSLLAVHMLEKAHLPIVSPDSYDEIQFASNVFHVAASTQNQGRQAALYAEHILHNTRAAIIADPSDSYSRCLAEGFLQKFEGDGNQIVAIETYSTGRTSAQMLALELQDALAAHPDFIYFTGGVVEGSVLLTQLHDSASSVRLLGGDKLYSFVGFSVNARPGFDRLAFTSAAYSDAPGAQHITALYALDFDAQDPDHVRDYGYSRPDNDAILSYDAMETLITAYTDAAGLQSLQQALASVHVEGASHTMISFTSLHELADQHLFMLYVDQHKQIRFITI